MLFLLLLWCLILVSRLLFFQVSTNTTVAYCCLLFFFNFFQYVKELFNPRFMIIANLKLFAQTFSTRFGWWVKNCGLEPFHVPLWRFLFIFFSLCQCKFTYPGNLIMFFKSFLLLSLSFAA